MSAKIQHYQNLVHETIPISRYMQWSIKQLNNQSISTLTQLAPNINVHGTGFAGSVYSAAMASGWTLMKCWSDQAKFNALLVAAEANIKYRQPVTTDFICQASISQQSSEYRKLLDRLSQQKSCAFPLRVEVISDTQVCAILDIMFVFKY